MELKGLLYPPLMDSNRYRKNESLVKEDKNYPPLDLTSLESDFKMMSDKEEEEEETLVMISLSKKCANYTLRNKFIYLYSILNAKLMLEIRKKDRLDKKNIGFPIGKPITLSDLIELPNSR
ncbi:hypothetical protein WA026_006081 [Henosepilachna vigintioctopunctata]|uniref:Uncharacterized protein n=1 Tax=Henosepilachna vigintioctopunctata TaxID=420089 RepID=A0AAW1TS52_9CUCU